MSSEFVARTFDDTNYSSPVRFIWSQIRRHALFGFLMVAGAFGNAALATIIPLLAGSAVDAINDFNDLSVVGRAALGVIGSQLVRGAVQFLRNYSSEIIAQRIERDVREELYVSLLGKSMTFHDFQPVGDLMARVTNDVREMNFMLNPGLNLIVGSGMFLILPIAVTLTIHPPLVLTPLLFVGAFVAVQFGYVTALHNIAQEVRSSFGQMNARLAESLDGIEVVKGTAQESQEVENFDSLVNRVQLWSIRQGDVEARYLAILLLGLAILGGFFHAAVLFRAGAIGVGDIVAFMGQIGLFGFPVFTSIFSYSRVASGYASAQRILSIINARTDLDQNEAGKHAPLEGGIVFEGVDFGYLDGRQVLHDVSFAIEPGQTIAIVGQTGSGKSTLTKLINRTYDVNSGRVLVDGLDVRDWNLASLRSQISMIEQEIFLFSRTIAENIRFGKPDATQAEIEEAARQAQAEEFILRFPDGYETVIGQRGVTLSGGQRQRLAIARAFLTDPRILILDDSTSAIDSATEDRIQQAIWAAAKGRTTILLTHRLSQIRWANHIVVLRQGRVVAQGTHEALLDASEPYRRIFVRGEDAPAPSQPPARGATGTQR